MRKVINDKLLPTVVESGSNSNGTYIKFKDGTLIQTGYALATDDVRTAFGSLYRSANFQTGTFPISFKNTDYSITLTARAALHFAYVSNTTASNFEFYTICVNATSGTAGRRVYYTAIGRWK